VGLGVQDAEVPDLPDLVVVEGVGRIHRHTAVRVPEAVDVPEGPPEDLGELGLEGRGHVQGGLSCLEDDDQEVHPVALLLEHGQPGHGPSEHPGHVREDAAQGDGLASLGLPTEHRRAGVGLAVADGIGAIAAEAVAAGGTGALDVALGQLGLALGGAHGADDSESLEHRGRPVVDAGLDDEPDDLRHLNLLALSQSGGGGLGGTNTQSDPFGSESSV